MDKYEVTVGRFKEFIANYDVWRAQGNPRPNAGTHAPGAGSGWQESWNSDPNSDSPLPPSARQLSDRANCADVSLATLGTPKDDGLPINCVSWYEAFAFCIWDGGRLATDAEWEYAAGNGDQHWEYPWGDQPVPDNAHAVFGCMWSGTSSEDCTLDDIAPVGSAKAGDGHWGQSDLAGSIMEWVFDNYAEFYPQPSCDNCVVSCDRCATDCSQSVGTSPCSSRVLRGGSFNRDDSDIAVSAREYAGPTARHAEFGIRCVRTVGGAGS